MAENRAARKKEQSAFVALTAIGWMLAIVMLFYDTLPSPTHWVDALFQPLGKLMEK